MQNTQKILNLLYSPQETHKLNNSKILLVGCGGIGCELIKNIIKIGFQYIVLIDNDYVELSNLNRQFYFTRQMINKPKSFAIRDILHRDYPHITVEAYYCDIQDKRFLSNFYQRFSLVFSALDNKEAKEHLCLKCIRYNMPLVIVGAEGYNGQMRVILRGRYECLFCDQKYEDIKDCYDEDE